MFDSADDFRKGRAPSLLAIAPAFAPADRGGGALLDVAPSHDAALRHGQARARRERKASPLLAAPMPVRHPVPEEDFSARRSAEDGFRPDDPVEDGFDFDEGTDDAPPAESARQSRLRAIVSRLKGGGADRAPREEEAPPPIDMPASPPSPEGADAPPPQEPPMRAAPRPPAPSPEHRPPPAAARRVAVLTVAGAALGAALAFAWPKSYVATSEMLIDPRETQVAGMAAPLSPDAAFALVDNQLRVLRSGSMLNAAAERLNLAADPEFNGAGAGPFGLGGALSGLGDLVAGDGASAVERRRRHVVEALARTVRAERVAGSSAVRVSAGTADPHKSALIANTISELFLANFGGAPENAGEADARLAALRASVEEAERAVETYKAENGLIDAQGRLISDEEILRLSERLSAAQARTVELNARAASSREADVDSIVTGSLPEQYASPSLTELRARHAGLRQQLDRISVKLGPLHPERLAAEAELEGARREIGGELRRVASALQTELRRAVEQEQELAAQLARMKARQGGIGDDLVALRELEREAEARRSAYEGALRMARAAGPGPAAGSASMISRAEPPLHASGPSLSTFSLAGALAGLFAGLGFSGWRGRARDTDHASEEPVAHRGTPQGKEADDMHPYPAYPQPAPDPQAAYPQPHPQPGPHFAGYAQAAPVQPAPFQQQPAHHPAAHHPAPPPMHAPAHPPAGYYPAPPPAWPPAPVMPSHDPWAHLRAYAPPPPPAYAAPAYAPPAPPVHTVVYMPAPQAPAPPPAAVEAALQEARQPSPAAPPRRPVDDAYDQNAYVDTRTDAAIEEIRQSLREFREAIEDFADREHRRYGT